MNTCKIIIMHKVVLIMISLIDHCCSQGSWLSWSLYFERFTFATMSWLTVREHLWNKWPLICSVC